MTFHNFLKRNFIMLDKKHESWVGKILSDIYKSEFTEDAPKIKYKEFLVNNYPIEWILSKADAIWFEIDKAKARDNPPIKPKPDIKHQREKKPFQKPEFSARANQN